MATIVALTASITIRAMTVTIQKDGKGVGENLCIKQVALDNTSHNFVNEWRIMIGAVWLHQKMFLTRVSFIHYSRISLLWPQRH